MKNLENYLEQAKKHETEFRIILDRFAKWEIEHKDLTVEEIFTEYSTGRRYGKWTILNFKETSPNRFEFVWQDVAALSGGGSDDVYLIEDGEIKKIDNISFWRS